jgi:hypothetical protein
MMVRERKINAQVRFARHKEIAHCCEYAEVLDKLMYATENKRAGF